MLRGLIGEIVRRRLWPVPVVALLVAAAAPLLFLKPAPGSSPSATAEPAASATVEGSVANDLPVRARALLKTRAAAKRAAKRKRGGADPFETPANVRIPDSDDESATDKDGASAAPAGAGPAKQEPVPVVITDEDGKVQKSGGDGTSAASTPSDDQQDGSFVAVDVRFTETKSGGRVDRAIPRRQSFVAEDVVVAAFVRYSAKRKKATFAISPNTAVVGSTCRKVKALCRYVDIPAGQQVWLAISGPRGTAVYRRLRVVRIRTVSGPEPSPPSNGSCLLRKLLKLGPGDPAIASGTCD